MGDQQRVPLQYEPQVPPSRGWLRSAWSAFFARLSRPMPMGWYFVIMIVLSIVGTFIAVFIVAIMRMFR
jgi:hypothetical protein